MEYLQTIISFTSTIFSLFAFISLTFPPNFCPQLSKDLSVNRKRCKIMEQSSPDDHLEEQVALPSTDIPDSPPDPSADQDTNPKGESNISEDSSLKEDDIKSDEQLVSSEKTSDMEETEKEPQQPEVELMEGRPQSISEVSHTSNSAASTPFGTPENRDHPLPDVSSDDRLEESPNILTNLRSSPTPRTIHLPDIAIASPPGSKNSNIASSRFVAYRHEPNSPTSNLVSSLKAQLEAVSEQRDMLNQKLVTSFSRMADLEDDLFQVRDSTDAQRRRIDELERERKEHLHALDTGLLVEQSNVKLEMQRLAASLMDEQGKRDLAEEGRQKVESEVDDLAASLFQQANSMVAAERLARSRAETRLVNAEENLSVAEGVVREMQSAMQTLSISLETSTLAKKDLGPASTHQPFRNDHLPYAEFLAFITHLRSMRPRSQSSAPPLTSLLQFINMAFLARMVVEDHEPALRLDSAPGISWLNKKSIGQAVVDSMLVVEPVSAVQVFSQKPEGDIVCALSGELISPALANPFLKNTEPNAATPAAPPPQSRGLSFFNRSTATRPISPAHRPALSRPGSTSSASHPPIYVFHIAPAASQSPSERSTTLYPVAEGWSLDRLRATCELWRFVKTGILNPVWNYEDGTTPISPPKLPARSDRVSQSLSTPPKASEAVKPVLPARKSNTWGLNLGFGKSSGSPSGGWGISKSQPGTPKEDEPIKGPVETPKLPVRKLPPPFSPKNQNETDEKKTASVNLAQPEHNLSDEPASSSVGEPGMTIPELLPSEPVAESSLREDEVQEESSKKRSEETPATPLETDLGRDGEPVEVVKLPPVDLTEASGDPVKPSSDEVEGVPTVDKPLIEEMEGPVSARASLEETDSNRKSLEQTSSRQLGTVPAGPAPPLPKRAAARRAVPPVPTTTTVSEAETHLGTPVSTLADETKEVSPVETVLPVPIVSDEPSLVTDLPDVPDTPDQPSIVLSSYAEAIPASSTLTLPDEESKEEIKPEITNDISDPPLSPEEMDKTEVAEVAEVTEVMEQMEKKAEVGESAPVKEESWEEKTWRKLAKLREDLFWKRIGVQPSEN